MTGPHALILAGSGMLTDVAQRLTRDGWTVVQPSRRYTPVPVSPDGDPQGRAVWVRARWDEPETLARRVAETLGATPIDLVVTWLREEDRGPVLEAVAPLIGPRAPVVDVRSAVESGLVPGLPEPASPLGDHPPSGCCWARPRRSRRAGRSPTARSWPPCSPRRDARWWTHRRRHNTSGNAHPAPVSRAPACTGTCPPSACPVGDGERAVQHGGRCAHLAPAPAPPHPEARATVRSGGPRGSRSRPSRS